MLHRLIGMPGNLELAERAGGDDELTGRCDQRTRSPGNRVNLHRGNFQIFFDIFMKERFPVIIFDFREYLKNAAIHATRSNE
jgi:hypothetical protein